MSGLTPARLGKEITAFLVFKRALGCRYRRGEFTLRSLERFAARSRGLRSPINLEGVIRAWLLCTPGRKPVTLADDLGAVRQFCLYRRRSDPTAFVPPVSLAPQTESHYIPYVFSLEEIRRLITAAEHHHGRNFWPGMFRMLLIATYCTGLRLGEAVRLRLIDLDQERGVLHIRESKGRSREVPFQVDLAQQFARYLHERAQLLSSRGREAETALFVGLYGRGITVGAASGAIRRLLRQLGMKNQTGRCGPADPPAPATSPHLAVQSCASFAPVSKYCSAILSIYAREGRTSSGYRLRSTSARSRAGGAPGDGL